MRVTINLYTVVASVTSIACLDPTIAVARLANGQWVQQPPIRTHSGVDGRREHVDLLLCETVEIVSKLEILVHGCFVQYRGYTIMLVSMTGV